MLNKKIFSEIIQEKFNNIHWKAEDSNEESILFYKLSETAESQKIFLEKIKNSKFKILILNRKIECEIKNSYVIEEGYWPELQYQLLNIIYPLPTLKLIGITGTNGKTTTADLVLQIGHLMGKEGISIGTLGVRHYQKTLVDFGLTSPSLIDLRKFLHIYGKNKDFCVLEVSSHALDQERIFGLKFDAAGWTSFSQDHLDYHGNMDNYFEAKLKIFNYLNNGVNLIIPSEQLNLFKKIGEKKINIEMAQEIKEELPVFFSTTYNKNNLEVAKMLVEKVFDIKVPNLFTQLTPPDGRFYIRQFRTCYIVVDFAHTPDALENICLALKKAFPKHELKVLFGCGGDRDRKKRSIMGQIAQQCSDWIYLTSDNPRSEEPLQIIDDIKQGITFDKLEIIPDRRKAVRKALGDLKENQVILLAGKGHENYILTNGVKDPYSDIEEVEKFISGNL